MVTGVDDHSRYRVIAVVVRAATSRAVCLAFAEALQRFGTPDEVLTDNGKQFTGRFNKPRPAEVLFERICRENGIVARNTKPRTPTTTGKIERFHQSLRRELLDDTAVWPDLQTAQAAVDAFRVEYNTNRPHQSLDMAFPAELFIPRPPDGRLPLRLPGTLSASNLEGDQEPSHALASAEAAAEPALVRLSPNGLEPVDLAIEFARVVPPSGIVTVCRQQQFWFGPDRSGTTIAFWADTTVVHIVANGVRLKTVPSRLSVAHLQRLLAEGARPAGQPPIPTGKTGDAIEVDRLVNASGQVSLAGRQRPIGYHFAGRRLTVRLDGALLQLADNGVLLRSLPNPLTPSDLARIRDARPAGPAPVPTSEPQRVERRVGCRGAIVVARQRIHDGIIHAGRTLTVESTDHTFRIYDHDELLIEAARTTTKPIARFKVRKPEPPRRSTR